MNSEPKKEGDPRRPRSAENRGSTHSIEGAQNRAHSPGAAARCTRCAKTVLDKGRDGAG